MKKLIISAAIAASSIAIVPEVAQAQNIRFQIIMGDENAVRRLCRQHRYSPYNIVNGRKCSEFKPKPKPKPDATVREIQSLLNELGYPAGAFDGLYGRKTGNALTEFMKDYGEVYDGKAGDEELAILRLAANGQIRKSGSFSGSERNLIIEEPNMPSVNPVGDFHIRSLDGIPYVAGEYANVFNGDTIEAIRVDTMTYK